MGLAFINGLISSMSACVYPLIPITTAIFGAGKTSHWLEGLFLSGIYVTGMAITYVGLGLIAALTGSVFGSYMGSPIAISIFALLFFTLGLGFLDIIPIPFLNSGAKLGEKFQAKKTNRYLYPLVLGIFSGFIAAPCTAPLYGAILLDIAKNASANKSLLPGLLQALFFSFGMGLPFFLVGGFALKLPKPGKWLKVVKYVGAVVLFTAGLHYLEDLVGPYPPQKAKVTMAILGLILCAVFFILADPLDGEGLQGFRKKSSVVFFLTISAFGLFLVTSLFTPDNTLHHQHGDHSGKNSLQWQSDLKTAMANTKDQLILVDFRADWCMACLKMEEELYPTKEFSNFVRNHNLRLVRLDYTEMDTEEKENIVQKYKIPGFPTILIIKANGDEVGRTLGFRNKKDELDKLENILTKGKTRIPAGD